MKKKQHWIHLLKNGALMYTDFLLESDKGIKKSYEYDPNNRVNAYDVLIRALNEGASKQQVMEVCDAWNMDDEDASIFAEALDIDVKETPEGYVAKWRVTESKKTLPKDSVFEAVASLTRRYPSLYKYVLEQLNNRG